MTLNIAVVIQKYSSFLSGKAVEEVTYTSVIHKSHNSHESNGNFVKWWQYMCDSLLNVTPSYILSVSLVLVDDNNIDGSTEGSVHVISDTVLYSTVKREH